MSLNDAVDEPLPTFRDVMSKIPWRVVAPWGVALGATFVIRELFDIFFIPTTDYGLRSSLSTKSGLAICFAAGFQGAWRTRHLGQGSFVALASILVGFFVAIIGDVATVLVVSTFHNLDLSRAVGEALEVPLPVMLVIGGIAGTAGAAVAAWLTKYRRP
jgi:hypothetical protein